MDLFHRPIFRPFLILLSLIALTGCVTKPHGVTDASGKFHEIPKLPDSERGIADMEMPQGFGTCKEPRIGWPIGERLTEKALIRLTRYSLATDLRVIFPGDPVTEDYRPGRVNVEVDATDHISKVSCG